MSLGVQLRSGGGCDKYVVTAVVDGGEFEKSAAGYRRESAKQASWEARRRNFLLRFKPTRLDHRTSTASDNTQQDAGQRPCASAQRRLSGTKTAGQARDAVMFYDHNPPSRPVAT